MKPLWRHENELQDLNLKQKQKESSSIFTYPISFHANLYKTDIKKYGSIAVNRIT